MSDGIAAFGTLLKIGDGGSPTEVFTTIAEVKDIDGPELEADTEEITHHSSTDGYKEYVVTLLNGGTVEFEVNMILSNATQSYSAGLLKDYEDKTLRNFQLVFPYGSPVTWAFSAFVVGFKPAAPVAGVLNASLSLQISGKPTLA